MCTRMTPCVLSIPNRNCASWLLSHSMDSTSRPRMRSRDSGPPYRFPPESR